MSDAGTERFRALVEEHFAFLESHGFGRARADEHDSAAGASVAYAGRHVGFLVTHDARDAQVDVRVVRARDGRLVQTGEGGYSRDLLAHLVEHAGYRGGFPRPAAGPGGGRSDALERLVVAWAALLRTEGGPLLADEVGALPRT